MTICSAILDSLGIGRSVTMLVEVTFRVTRRAETVSKLVNSCGRDRVVGAGATVVERVVVTSVVLVASGVVLIVVVSAVVLGVVVVSTVVDVVVVVGC